MHKMIKIQASKEEIDYNPLLNVYAHNFLNLIQQQKV